MATLAMSMATSLAAPVARPLGDELQTWLTMASEWLLRVDAWMFLAILIGSYVILHYARRLLGRWISGGEGDVFSWRRTAARVITQTSALFLLALAAYLAILSVEPNSAARRVIEKVTLVIFVIQLAVWVSQLLVTLIARFADTRAQDSATLQNARALIRLFVHILVWAIAFLLILDNLGFDVTALIAGLGVGGIAIALAAQGIFSDLFASLSIVLDKPFVAGDFVTFGDIAGNVEKVGLRSTQIRSLSGEQIVVSNTDLISTRLRNFKRMRERRILFHIGIVYGTPADKVGNVPDLIRKAVEGAGQTRLDRCHFQAYGDFALIFETVYYVLSPDYNVYMDKQHAINMALFESFAAERIEFAFPTQTLYVNRGEGWPNTEPRRKAS